MTSAAQRLPNTLPLLASVLAPDSQPMSALSELGPLVCKELRLRRDPCLGGPPRPPRRPCVHQALTLFVYTCVIESLIKTAPYAPV